jgi:hypothetical protein
MSFGSCTWKQKQLPFFIVQIGVKKMNKVFALTIVLVALTGLTAWKCEYNPTYNQPAPTQQPADEEPK